MKQIYNKKTTCCFTGHRYIPLESRENIKTALYKAVTEHISRGVRTFISGGALGFDTLAAQCVLDIKKQYPETELVMILPCRDQSEKWSERDRRIYEGHLSVADDIYFLNDRYVTGCMHQRNRAMISQSGFCIACFDGKPGGTAYTFNLAKEQGLNVTNIYYPG